MGGCLLFNALEMKFRELRLRRDPQCPLCGENPTITKLIDYEMFCGIPRRARPHPASNPDEVTVQEMKQALDDPNLGIKVIDVREPDEYQIAHIDGVPLIPAERLAATVHGTGPQPADLHSLQERRAFPARRCNSCASRASNI